MTVMSLALIAAVQSLATAQAAPADSAAMLHAARNSQGRFERLRIDLLPVTTGSSDTPCTEIIGRFCFRDTGGEPDIAPPEPDGITSARRAMLGTLASVARSIPGDEWVAGQRVRYLVEAQDTLGALAAARDCRPQASWWCLALEGYALHSAARFREAEQFYDQALASMPPAERCGWTDLSLLLTGAQLREYAAHACGTRDSLEHRFWGLADALALVPGNERRSEHFSRLVFDRMQEGAHPAYGFSWGKDLRQVVVRYGRPSAWYRAENPWRATPGEHDIRIGLPGGLQFENLATTSADAARALRGPAHSRYAPAGTRSFDTLEYQFALFQRDDHIVLVAGFDLSSDSVAPTAPARTGLFVIRSADDRSVHEERGPVAGSIAVEAPRAPGIVSLEILTDPGGHLGLIRQPFNPKPPTDSIELSDLLLLARSDSLPASLPEATALARAGTRVQSGLAVGLYWEVYAKHPGIQPISLSLTLTRENGGFLRRAAKAIGLGGDTRPTVSLEWQTQTSATGVTPGSLALDLARNNPGRYTLQLEVTSRDHGTARVQRELTILR